MSDEETKGPERTASGPTEVDSPALFHAANTVDLPLADGQGLKIGPYRILQLLGEGGFGSVYMAEQSEPIRRRVALKVIKAGMDTRQVIARFEQERQALAMMDHPAIAQVLDAGTTDSGRPYFVMELVRGESVTEYCDKHNLPVASRLELFAEICSAVQHAHTKGIIHRDLKPSNILVTFEDGQARAKVIDFGIAKATAGNLTDKTLYTEHRALVGTPEYMSPEQAEGSLDIDTRTDVYSLGVMLYRMLSGKPPFSAAGTGELMAMHIYMQPQPLKDHDPTLPEPLIDLVHRMLAKQRQDRPSMAQVEQELEKVNVKVSMMVPAVYGVAF